MRHSVVYEWKKEKARQREAEMSLSGRDIGDIPKVANPERRKEAEGSFRFFCETYFSQIFTLAWSDDHLKVIGRIEESITKGGLFALAMPRGSGKTSLCERGAIWAVLTGRRQFVALLGAENASAVEMMESIKMELSNNELLAEDFPEVCYPIAKLEGISQRANGQLHGGVRTYISWRQRQLVLPSVEGSSASGAIIRTAGITGRIRGMKYQRQDGASARPDLVIIDDPQTDGSAQSAQQNAKRLGILTGAILGLSGPGKKIAGIMPCTVIRQGDMADKVLDSKEHPEWNGERMKMVYAFPTDTQLWGQYTDIYLEGLRKGDNNQEANLFYRNHQKEMDKGAVVQWEARHEANEISAIQHAMNLKAYKGDAFFAEYQNEPAATESNSDIVLDKSSVEAKIIHINRGIVPMACHQLTAFVDVQQKVLWWVVMGWGDGFNGHIIDYGCWPEQNTSYYTLKDVKRTLETDLPASDLSAQIYAGLNGLASKLCDRVFKNESGVDMNISMMCVDANWGQSTDVVYQWCRESKYKAIVIPSHGRGIGASNKPMSEYENRVGERSGHHWRMVASARRGTKYLLIDTNYWKTFVRDRIMSNLGSNGTMTIYHDTATRHRMLVEHLTSEYSVRVSGQGRSLDEWKIRPARDNHLWDCVVGASAVASLIGVQTIGHIAEARPIKKTRKKAVYL